MFKCIIKLCNYLLTLKVVIVQTIQSFDDDRYLIGNPNASFNDEFIKHFKIIYGHYFSKGELE